MCFSQKDLRTCRRLHSKSISYTISIVLERAKVMASLREIEYIILLTESLSVIWTIMNVVVPIYAVNGIFTSLRRNKSRL